MKPGTRLLVLGVAALLSAQAFAAPPARDPYAPLTSEEWKLLMAEYRQVAACEDGYMSKQNINGGELGRRLVKDGKGAEVKTKALALLDPESPWRKSLGGNGTDAANETTQALMALMMDANQDGRTRTETAVRVGYARYFTAMATQGACTTTPRYLELLEKGAH
ncbi:hypothetical protein EC912_101336 [Luteibacter rhizovicinus]|uniref:Uncharacterized protein n=1 Tax=Luteibacter rhizovicinus TaxID=242606 RepID=A0A4R3YXP2_9GAMM|nr:hypothetical protein [Luteibacter rhizovicinus]TCV97336.1 hypothetical protein EC912_101336 [Luteibacter rhizovicinus]